MSRLLFAQLDEAFHLRSPPPPDTQSEIDNLKKIITEGTLVKKTKPTDEMTSTLKNEKRVGYSDKVVANFDNFKTQNQPEMDILKIMQHPKFDDIVKNYIIIKNPEWINKTLKETNYSKESFGQKYSTTPCSNIQNYVLFFIIALLIYLVLEKMLN
jgi:hypothetical protein